MAISTKNRLIKSQKFLCAVRGNPDLIEVAKLGDSLVSIRLFSDSGSFMLKSGPEIGDFSQEHGEKKPVMLQSISVIRRELPQSALGWPLLPKINCSDSNQANLINSTIKDGEINEENIIIKTSKDRILDFEPKLELPSSFVPLIPKKLPKSSLGWPLFRVSDPVGIDSLKEMSVVEWVMTLPSRSHISFGSTHTGKYVEEETNFNFLECVKGEKRLIMPEKLPKESKLKLITSGLRQFSYAELRRATCHFSSGNLIGEGGCSKVYKGCLPGGISVAVKYLKSYKESWNDFSLEIEIVSSLKHKHITPLIGVCVEHDHLISVYDLFPKGSLEDILHGGGEKCLLSWETRFNVAVAVADALNYLQNECAKPVIHRDVKSSNILLFDDFQPQLSDFGLATWGPTDARYVIEREVVGTFGYMAPEYFSQGRVSHKIDVYAFGVVLLELLSGKRPITSVNHKGHGSLVRWAKPLLESGDFKALMDERLNGEFDEVEMHRMALAAKLCINQSVRLRPTISQVLKVLREEDYDIREWDDSEDQECDDPFSEPNFAFSLDEVISVSSSFSSVGSTSSSTPTQNHRRLKLRDYFQQHLH